MNLRRHSFVVRYLTLFGGEAVSKLCVFAAFAYVARTLGPQNFGIIELALTITVFCVIGADSGLGTYGARKIEQAPALLPQLIPRIIVLRAILSLPIYLVLLSLSLRYGKSGMGVLMTYGIVVLAVPFFTQWVFQGLRQMQWVAGGSALRYAIFSIVVFALVRSDSDPRVVAFAEVCGAVALAAFNLVLLRRVLTMRLDWHGAVGGAFELLRETWTLGASDLAWAAMWYSPTLITGWIAWWARADQIAWLAAAVRIVMALHTFVFLYFFNLIPNLSKELHHGVESWRTLVHRSLSASIWAPCFIALAGTLLAPQIVSVVYGPGFEPAALPLQIIIWMIPIVWISGHFRCSLIAAGHQHLECTASVIAGGTTVLLAYIGFRTSGVSGAAAALVAGGIVHTVMTGIFMTRAIGPIRFGLTSAALITCVSATLVEMVVAGFTNAMAGAAAALLFYGAIAARQWNVSRFRLAWEGRLD